MNFNTDYLSKGYNLNINHPIQPNEQDYFVNYKKYVSIHSEDRDINKYPSSSNYEIEIPQDILNASQVRLVDWSFPANYDVFSLKYENVLLSFKINNPYNPGEHDNDLDVIANLVYQVLFLTQDTPYIITIEEGFYNQTQMTTELTRKMNAAVTARIDNYYSLDNPLDPVTAKILKASSGYSRFVIVYHEVEQSIWFGNKADGFTLTTSSEFKRSQAKVSGNCDGSNTANTYANWGLPSNLGLLRTDANSISKPGFSPRFYYGDVVYGDNGYWLLPESSLIGSTVEFYKAPNKINFMGDAFFYMEIQGLNCIDETSPYNLTEFTATTNQTNGIANASFAKISVPTTPLSQWFDKQALPYMYFAPPAERLRRFKIKIRYHNGTLVDFNVFPYSFTLEFICVRPQILRTGKYVISDNSLVNSAVWAARQQQGNNK
jgi:hypothetical protein